MRIKLGKIIICIICGKEKYYEARKLMTAKFCSAQCYYIDKRNKPTWNKGVKGYKQPNISIAMKGKFVGSKSSRWKGENIQYHTLHEWVAKIKGKPTKCEHCYKEEINGYKIHWANKSGQYKRDLSDWIRLCILCHRKYDNHSDKLRRAWARGAYANRNI